MTDREIKEKLFNIIENNPTDWPWLMVSVLMNDTTQRTAEILDEICQFESIEEAKQVLLNPKH